MEQIDFMAIGAHADDVEICAGGTIAKMCAEGKRGIIVDMTEPTAATRGTPAQRGLEAENALKVLGDGQLTRINLKLHDAHLAVTDETIETVIRTLRTYRPTVVLTHYFDDYHPDHYTTGEIVKAACYKSGLKSLMPELEPFRPKRLFHFMGPVWFEPTFCIDISKQFETKIAALMEYKSQFHTEQSEAFEGKTDISSPEFMDFIKSRARMLGTRIKSKQAEGFWCRELAEVQDLTSLSGDPY
ncbi:MAG: bacillithiol biosynthesis deacetylase BshB1 [Fibrobacterales bacterium]